MYFSVCFPDLFLLIAYITSGGRIMKITVNGEETVLEKAVNIEDLLVITHAETPEYVTVQVNDEFIDRNDFATTLVNDGDSVEYLYFMGGGQL